MSTTRLSKPKARSKKMPTAHATETPEAVETQSPETQLPVAQLPETQLPEPQPTQPTASKLSSLERTTQPTPAARRPQNRFLRLSSRLLIAGLILAAVLGLGTASLSWLTRGNNDDTLTFVVKRRTLLITVTERGNLESQKTVDGTCELSGYQNKIIFIVDEGSLVKKGDVVVRFDSAEIDKEFAEQEIEVNQAKAKVEMTKQEVEVQKNQGESDIAEAELELKLADLDLVKYKEGDSKVEENDLRGKIALANAELEKAKDAYANFKVLVKKAFRVPEQLRAMKQEVEYANFNLQRDERTLDVLVKYDYDRTITEFEAKAKEAVRKVTRAKANAKANLTKAKGEYESAKSTFVLEEQQLAEHKEQKGECEILAEQAGVVAYANQDWYDSSRRIREGAVVHRRRA